MTEAEALEEAKRIVLLLKEDKPDKTIEMAEDTPEDKPKVDGECKDGEDTVKGTKVTDIKDKPKEDEKELEMAEDEANTEPKMEDVLNMQGLAELINLPNLQDGYISISASVVEGKLAWGEMYTEDYKILMSEQKADTDKQILELQEQLKKEKDLVVALSEAKPSEAIINAPTPTPTETRRLTNQEITLQKLGFTK